jgi:hypothetical protein
MKREDKSFWTELQHAFFEFNLLLISSKNVHSTDYKHGYVIR